VSGAGVTASARALINSAGISLGAVFAP